MRQCGAAGGAGPPPPAAAGADGAAAGVAAGDGAVGRPEEGLELICPGCQVLPPGAKSCDKHGKGKRWILLPAMRQSRFFTAFVVQILLSGSVVTVAEWLSGFASARLGSASRVTR